MISLAGLLLTIVPPFLFFKGAISFAGQNTMMLIGFLAWFVSAWFWLGKRAKQKSEG
jgi:high-affinity Fe2+/Pb2+ permease